MLLCVCMYVVSPQGHRLPEPPLSGYHPVVAALCVCVCGECYWLYLLTLASPLAPMQARCLSTEDRYRAAAALWELDFSEVCESMWLR